MAIGQFFRSAKTLTRVARDSPRRALDLVEARIEHRFGVDLHRLDPKRRRIRAFEVARTAAPDASIREFGNYYVDPALLPEAPVVFSVGIGEDLDFDRAISAAYPKGRMFLFDPTPRSERFVNASGLRDRVHFERLAIADRDGTLTLFIDDLEDDLQSTTSVSVNAQSAGQTGIPVPCRSVSSLMKDHGVEAIDLFKFDVEGAGFIILRSLFDADIWPTQIAGEFEGPAHSSGVGEFLRSVGEVFDRLETKGYRLYRTRPDYPGFQVEFLAVRGAEGNDGQ